MSEAGEGDFLKCDLSSRINAEQNSLRAHVKYLHPSNTGSVYCRRTTGGPFHRLGEPDQRHDGHEDHRRDPEDVVQPQHCRLCIKDMSKVGLRRGRAEPEGAANAVNGSGKVRICRAVELSQLDVVKDAPVAPLGSGQGRANGAEEYPHKIGQAGRVGDLFGG